MSSRLVLLGEDAFECAVGFGVVGEAVLPAVPDDVQPGAGEDADGVGVVVAAVACSVVEVGGPGVGVSGVGCEVGDGVAQLFVAGPSEADGAEFPGLAGGGCCAGQAGQRLRGGEPGAAVTDLAQQPGGADSARSGQAGEDVRVGVGVELVVDLLFERLDLLDQGAEQRDVAGGDVGLGGAVDVGRSACRVDDPLVQDGGVDLAGVALLGQPVTEPLRAQPVDLVLGVEPGQEGQADRGVELVEQADHGGQHQAQVRTQLVGSGDTVFDQVLAGSTGATQRDGVVTVGNQWPQPGTVSAQGVGQHVSVEPVVLVAGRPVTAAQVLDLVRADHHHGQISGEQGLDDRPVGALDGDLGHAVLAQHVDELSQACGSVLDGASVDLSPAAVRDRDRVVVDSPVDARGEVVGWELGQCVVRCDAGRLHVSLLAASSSGEAPSSSGGLGAGTCLPVRSLKDRKSTRLNSSHVRTS